MVLKGFCLKRRGITLIYENVIKVHFFTISFFLLVLTSLGFSADACRQAGKSETSVLEPKV